MAELLRVGIIGAGAMGASHAHTLATAVTSARVTHVFDMDRSRAVAVADAVGAAITGTAADLVAAKSVDAVIVASPDATHSELVLNCLTASKPVLCEKPLAINAQSARQVVEVEVRGGRRLVQVGFMRRYDPSHRELRELIATGLIGKVRVIHAVHRNASSTTSIDDSGLVTGSMIHELDSLPWLLDQPITGVRIESPVVDGFRDPQLATVWFQDGTMATVEVFVNAGYGYDVQCEVVGSAGTATLESTPNIRTRIAGRNSLAVRDDFVAHFQDAYRLELTSWVRSCLTDQPEGPSAWDGYVALVAASAGVRSLATGQREAVDPGPRPSFYHPTGPSTLTGVL